MAAQSAVKPQMHSAASTASQHDVIKANYEKVCKYFSFAKKKKKKKLSYKKPVSALFFNRRDTFCS